MTRLVKVLVWITCAVSAIAASPGQSASPAATPDVHLRQLIQQAQADFQQGKFPNAADSFRQAVQLAPNNGRLHLALGLSLMKAGMLAASYEVLQRTELLLPGDTELLLALIQVEISLGKLDLARQHASRAGEIVSQDVRLALLNIQIEGLSGDLPRVQDALRATAKRFPQNGKLQAEIGHWMFAQRRPEYDPLALAALLRAQQMGVRDPGTYLALASLQSMTGATGDAIQNAVWVMDQPSVGKDQEAAAAAIAGECSAQLGRLQDALDHMNRAAELQPNVERHHILLARLHRSNGDYATVVASLREAQKHVPNSPDLLYALGENLLASGRPSEAVAVLSDLTSRFPDRHEARGLLAEAYRAMGEVALASQTLRELSESQPDFPMIHVMLAQSLWSEGSTRYEAILLQLDLAEKTSAADPEVYYLRGRIYMALDRYREAVEALEDAISLQPDSPSYRYQLGRAYQRQGKREMADEQFDKMRHLREP